MAVIVDSYSESNWDAYYPLDNTAIEVGQSFTGNNKKLSACKFYLRRVGSPTGNATAYLYAHTGIFGGSTGKPIGSPLAVSTNVLNVATLLLTPQLINFIFDESYILVSGTRYFIVIKYTTGTSLNNVLVGQDSSASAHAGGRAHVLAADPLTWIADGGSTDLIFYVYGISATIALTGTATASITEADIVNGGKTIILTITFDTWVAVGATFDAQRQNIINGLDSAQAEATGWDAEVKAKIPVTDVVRTSDTVVTITLSAEAGYNITAQETITAAIPATALTGWSAIVASPTFTVDYTAVSPPVVSPYLLPDKNKPSGYHCFASQFIKNLLAGYPPLKKPDGTRW